jgi:hypothetical protein
MDLVARGVIASKFIDIKLGKVLDVDFKVRHRLRTTLALKMLISIRGQISDVDVKHFLTSLAF